MTASGRAAAHGTSELQALTSAVRAYRPLTLAIPTFRQAAVLVPLVLRGDRLELMFTVRSADLSSHAGQIAFPGGALDAGEDAVDAALRETHEEIGVCLDRSAILGALDDQPSPAGYVATPFVALLDSAAEPVPNPAEVAAVFSAPLHDLREIVPSWEERRLERFRRRIHYYPWNGRLIWGFTGNVLENLLRVASLADGGGPGAPGDGRSAW